jgi:small subunit ribosomal protein YMR-31
VTASVNHTPHAHPASPSHTLPEGFASASSTSSSSSASFSSYRQQAQQHGPLGRKSSQVADGSLGSHSGHSLGSVASAKGEYFDRNELPARFRRKPFTQDEIDAIETGGATLVC